MKRFPSPSPASPSWNHLIPAVPEGVGGAILTEPPVQAAVDLPVATFMPQHYEPGFAYPLVVWLHDSGDSERYLPQVMRHVSLQNLVAVAPRAPRDFAWQQTPGGILAAGEAVEQAIELAQQRFHIHPQRIFLVGHGGGGTMALRLALFHPARFAGVASLAGPLPAGHRPFRHLNQLRQFPFLIATSRQCESYGETQMCRDLRLLHAAGCSVALRQYPGDEALTTAMLEDLNRWIMERACEGTLIR